MERLAAQGGYIYGTFWFPTGQFYAGWSLDAGDPAPVVIEIPSDARGRRHGFERTLYENGQVEWQVPWIRGRMHGRARQFDEDGRCLVSSPFVRGTGLDVWVGCAGVTEVRAIRANLPHGFERWGHPASPWEENHWLDGRPAGIWRRWDGEELEDGYPKFFVRGREVSMAAYQRARQVDPRLPAARAEDDHRTRSLPGPLSQVWLRSDTARLLLERPVRRGIG